MIARALQIVARLLPLREIRDEGGTLYLSRYRIVGSMTGRHPWFPFTAYLHRFHRPDQDRDLHNHPWPWAVSLVLVGGYREIRHVPGSVPSRLLNQPTLSRWLTAGMLNVLHGNTFHRVAELAPEETWTLFLVARKVQAWGYDVPGRGFVPWRQHAAERNELETPNRTAKNEALDALADLVFAVQALADRIEGPRLIMSPLVAELGRIERSLTELGAGIADKWPATSGRR